MRYAGWAVVTTMCACGRIGFDTPSATLVVEDGFEAPSFDTMLWGTPCVRVDGVDSATMHGGSQSLRFHYGPVVGQQTYCGIAPNLSMLDHPNGMTDVYVRAWVYIATPEPGATIDIGRPLVQMTNYGPGGVGQHSWTVSARGYDNGANNGFGGGLLAYELDRTTLHQQCTYYDAQTPACGGPAPRGSATQEPGLRVAYDSWHCVEAWARCNSDSGAGDGRWMAWIDGTLKIDFSGYDGCGPWPASGSGYNTLAIGEAVDAGAGSPSIPIDEYRYWDDYAVFDTTGTDYRGVPTTPGCRQH